MSTAAAIVVAAGTGQRTGLDVPKQFIAVAGKPALRWSVEALAAAHQHIAQIVVVVATEHKHYAHRALAGIEHVDMVAGGASRQKSVQAGLDHLATRASPPDHVLIHDAARPGLMLCHIDGVLSALVSGHAAVAPALPVADALVRVDGAGEVSCVARDGLERVQTPQGFCFVRLREALDSTSQDDGFPDEISLMHAVGNKIHLIDGDDRLMKITIANDVLTAQRSLARPVVRMGTGYDVHGFGTGDHVILCGVRIPHDRSLLGHSDADVGWHCLTDAILGALALGDIGDHFPSSDPRWTHADSARFLIHARDLALENGYCIVNADLTAICTSPRLSPHREAMRRTTADTLGVSLDRISVKATTTDGVGALGRDEGIAAQAVVGLGWT